eukprot:TRINITY_DN69381_c0_g1_i2.p2 TRINITY_DN69381_c0_g1~~TRINITY_DN69381_c0_g1_i2.p2  ORF type:complete len:152 (+),score=26.84 TRINITY_DN69381_c0_g1_i2:208-663(+)
MGGNKSSRHEDQNKLKAKYIKLLHKWKEHFVREEIAECQNAPFLSRRLSLLADQEGEELDWKAFFEEYLEDRMQKCFWARELLEFFRSNFVSKEKRWVDHMFNARFSHYLLGAVSYTHLRAHETSLHLVCRLLLEKKKPLTQPHNTGVGTF